MTEVENKLIVLNSKNGIQRNSTYLSDMLFNFQNILSDDDTIISSNISVMNAQIPVSFYIINETNYYLQIESSSPFKRTGMEIPFGNYNANTLVSYINSKLLADGNTIVVSFNSVNGKLVFTGGGGVTVSTDTTDLAIRDIIGWRTTSYVSGSSPLTMPYPLNLLGVKKISIKSQLLGITSFDSGTNQNICLTTIPNNNAPFTMINYSNQTNLNKSLIRVRKIDAIDIIIEDENGNKINFNGVDWTITLVLENIRKMSYAEIPKLAKILEQQNELIPDGVYGE